MNAVRFELPTGCPECVSGMSCAEYGRQVFSLIRVYTDQDGLKSPIPNPYDQTFNQQATSLVARLAICPMFKVPQTKSPSDIR